jgi:sigma-B regulation protein RsbU (phosphoserine phosphatase)
MTHPRLTAPRLMDIESHRLVCSEIWGGIGAIDQEVSTAGITASISSVAVGGGQGGDIHYLSYCSYDFLTRIAIADVRGHGESVTLISSWVYAALQAQMNTLDGDRVLSDLNSKIHERGFEAMTTAAVLSYDRDQRCLHFCYAGHPPAMIWRRAAGWQRLENMEEQETSNLPLGVTAAAVYEQAHISLTPGDRMVMFTDGLLDAEDRHGESFGERRLAELLNEEGATSVAGLKYAILDRLLDHAGGQPIEDDLTVLAVEVR